MTARVASWLAQFDGFITPQCRELPLGSAGTNVRFERSNQPKPPFRGSGLVLRPTSDIGAHVARVRFGSTPAVSGGYGERLLIDAKLS